MIFHVICFAFLIVIASTAMFVPVLLYVFNLKSMGWSWEHAALFSAMIASTDAVAVSAILKKGGAPHVNVDVASSCKCPNLSPGRLPACSLVSGHNVHYMLPSEKRDM